MHLLSSIGAEPGKRSALAARISAITALAAAVAVIVGVLVFAHASGGSTIHTIRPLPHNFFGR
jgi:hypothetical protein